MKKILYLLLFVPFFGICQPTPQIGDYFQGGYVFNSNQISIKVASPLSEFHFISEALNLADTISFSGYSDWEIPSLEDLTLIKSNIGSLIGFNQETSYWSSSTNSEYDYYSLSFDPNNSTTSNNNNNQYFLVCLTREIPFIIGCTDNFASNYDDLAWENDSSCIYNTYPLEDENFKAYLEINYPQTIINDSLNINATSGITDINIDNLEISSLDGLQYFYDLINLNCVTNNLSTLPELPSQIEYINCQWNQIDTLPDFPESLKNFDGRHNLITVVPTLPNTMEVLRVCFNEVTTIPELPDSLKILFCAYNYEQLTYLPDFPNHLEEVLCFDNEIEQISDIPETMYKFMMQNNSITQIPNIPEGVNILNLSNNPIECVNDYPEQFEEQLGVYPPCSFLDEYTALMDSLDQLSNSNEQLTEDLSVFETVEEEQDYSMSFNGIDDKIITPVMFNAANDFTFSSWIKTISVADCGGCTNTIVNTDPHTIFALNVDPWFSTDQFALGYGNGGSAGWYNEYYSFDSPTEVLSNWTNIVVSKNDLEWKTFHNGVLIDSFLADVQPSSVLASLVIGSSSYLVEDKDYFHGNMNNVQLWDISLTQEEIQSYMSCLPTGEESGLVGFWNFNEGSGDTVYDISGNGNHGVIYGGAEFSADIPESYNGCTDELALNYDETALCDNGACVYDDEIVSNLEDVISTVNSELDNTVSSLNDVIETWQSSIDLTNESLDAISGITQMLNSFNSVIDLSEGWNMIGYGCPESMDVEESLSDYTDLILLAKANNGSAYLPEYGFNGIGDFTPGYGYQLKTSDSIEEFSLCYNYTVIDNTEITEIEIDNAQMQNDVNCLTGNPQIGDYCYGGIVFYVDSSGQHGLVAALADITEGDSDPQGWGFNGFEWDCYGTSVSGADGQGIGTGSQNTLDIVAQNCQTQNSGITAAQATLNYTSEGFTDWYLPSFDELQEMYNTIGNGGSEGNIGVFDTNDLSYYWSSSEYDYNFAWYVYFNNGTTNVTGKFSPFRVRTVRAF